MLKAIIFVCIRDAPGGFTVSWQTKGKSRCTICMDRTTLVYLSSSKKISVHETPTILGEKI
jgi:hypothetical protein